MLCMRPEYCPVAFTSRRMAPEDKGDVRQAVVQRSSEIPAETL